MKGFSTLFNKPLRQSLLLCLGIICSVPLSAKCLSADVAIVNTTIYTVNPKQPQANHVAYQDGKIVALSQQPLSLCPGTSTISGQGLFVYPGFTDAHAHLKSVGYRDRQLNLQGLPSLAATMAAVTQYGLNNPQKNWITGRGWIEKTWPEQRFPTRYDLDKAVPNRPAVLMRADGHALLANSVALKLAGITQASQAPRGGAIKVDPKGTPTGLLVDKAMALIASMIPAQTRSEDQAALAQALQRNVTLGWTQVQNAGGSMADFEFLQTLEQQGKLKHRVYYAVSQGPAADELLLRGAYSKPNSWLTARSIKLYADGALGSRGAALLENYHDDDHAGLLQLDQNTAMPLLTQALRQGLQIQTHAIGDKANRLVLDWYQQAFALVPDAQRKVKQPRWRIEHAQNIQPQDQLRFKTLGIIASMQPSHAIGDLHFASARLGQARLANAYVWQNMIDLGVKIAGGSDAPVEIGDPRIEFYAAVARKDLTGFSAKGWHPELALSRTDALKMFTLWPAYAAFEDSLRGSIALGKAADFTIFDSDIMQIPEAEITNSSIAMTIVGGKLMYKNLSVMQSPDKL